MYKDNKILVIVPCYNEQNKISAVVSRQVSSIVDEVLVVDDGSTDKTSEAAAEAGAKVLSLGRICGVGFAIREGFRYARENNFDIAAVMAGNNKDSPEQIERLLTPIAEGDCDFVQGSRYLKGGSYGGDMSLFRKLATRFHPFLFSMVTGRRITDSTNGFRAVRTSMLDDTGINLEQSWLDKYELEPYLFYMAIKQGHNVTEVPVTKIYPDRKMGNTKMKPVIDWWSILKPLILLKLGLRR